MRFIGTVLAVLYAGLMLFAVCAEPAKSISSVIIIMGCVLIAAYALFGMVRRSDFIWLLIAGMVCICVGTLINGLRQGSLHISHHIIRFAVEAVIVAVCWIGKLRAKRKCDL